jgi:hypothetical protein
MSVRISIIDAMVVLSTADKQKYLRPRLTTYGAVNLLTAGGTGMNSEAMVMGAMVMCNYSVLRTQNTALCPDIP